SRPGYPFRRCSHDRVVRVWPLSSTQESHVMHRVAPAPAALTHLRASDAAGAAIAGQSAALTVVGVLLATRSNVAVWLIGQLILAIAFVQWFALLHECGHETLCRTRRVHALLGHVAAFFSIIPFYNWKRVHGLHHKWTG